ncbi:hypothetical protein Bca101_014714 [Brassica carinata]
MEVHRRNFYVFGIVYSCSQTILMMIRRGYPGGDEVVWSLLEGDSLQISIQVPLFVFDFSISIGGGAASSYRTRKEEG